MDYRELINEAQVIMDEAFGDLPGGSTRGAYIEKKLEDVKELRQLVIDDYKKLKRSVRTEFDKKLVDVLKAQIETLRVAIEAEDTNKAKKLADELVTMNDERDEDKINAAYDKLTSGTSTSPANTPPDEETETPPDEETETPPDESSGTASVPPTAVRPVAEAGTQETQKKYKVNLNKPIEAAILGLRCIHDTGTTPINGNGKIFLDQITQKLASRESAIENFMKLAADEDYQKNFTGNLVKIKENGEESDVTASSEDVIIINDEKFNKKDAEFTMENWMADLRDYTYNNCYDKVRKNIRDSRKINPDYKVLLQGENKGMINGFYTTMVAAFPFNNYQQAVVDAEERDVEVEDWIKACIYNRLYYIYIIYRFSVSISFKELIPRSEGAKGFIKLSSMNKVLGGDKDDMGNQQSVFGTETNVENIFNQALEQASKIEASDITFFESVTHTIDMANRFLGEADEVGKKVPLPKILTDFVAIMKMVKKTKAYSEEKFNNLVKANELNKVDLMQDWLTKNKKVAEKNNYLQTALQFMVYSKMYGAGGDAKWAEKFTARNPKTAKAVSLAGKGLAALFTGR